MHNLNARVLEIFKILIFSTKPKDIATISNVLKVSDRTVRYDINRLKYFLKEYNIEIRTISKKGIYLLATDKNRCIDLIEKFENVNSFQDNYEEKIIYNVLFYLSFRKKNLSIDELCENIYISRSLAYKIIKIINA